jgi:hypothetical protein
MRITLHNSSKGIQVDYCTTRLNYGHGDVIDEERAVEGTQQTQP